MSDVLYPKSLFENIGLSLSGGGYRAAGFHLGTLSYLHHLKIGDNNLLEKVKILSTISGGTITGMMYAYHLKKRSSFPQFYLRLYRTLNQDALLESALTKLNNPKSWKNQHKNKNVINAFAEVYNDDFFEGAQFDLFFEGEQIHLEELIFNATGLKTGTLFRFQKTKSTRAVIGNRFTQIPREIAGEFRLADIVAASSCFPGGFEPLELPRDFMQKKNSALEKFWFEKKWSPMGLMDGGILDNQGINSVEMAERRRRDPETKQYLDLFLVSDVGSKYMEAYEFPRAEGKKWWSGFTLNNLERGAWILAIPSLIGLIVSIFYSSMSLAWIVTWSILMTVGILVLPIFIFAKRFIKSSIQKQFPIESKMYLPRVNILYNLPLYSLLNLLQVRAGSLLKISSDIFMKQIKSGKLQSLFSHPKWQKRLAINLIYTIAESDCDEDLDSTAPSEKMQEISKAASQMETTLWFTQKEEKEQLLKKLVTCGQFTTCNSLLRYLEKLEKDKNANFDESQLLQIQDLKQKLLIDFKKFKGNPYFLTDDYNA